MAQLPEPLPHLRLYQSLPEAKDGATPIQTWTSNALLREFELVDSR
jgi:hypothetical protein